MVDRVALLSDLKKLLKLLQDDLRVRCDHDQDLDATAKTEWQATRQAGRTAEDYVIWREEWLTQVGAAWLLAAVFVRFMEDTDLIGPPRLSGAGDRRRVAQDCRTQYFNEFPTHSDRDYLLHVFETVATLPAANRLFDRRHNPLWRLGPSGDMATRIIDLWHRIDPASGRLAHDFSDEAKDTRFLGDLYQDLSDEAQKKYALLQTPEFVEEFILDRTLSPAIDTFGYNAVRLIDPACGSGHFLLGAFRRMFKVAQQREPGTNSWELVRRVLSAIHGVDINPFAVAIARFRLLVAALSASGISRLVDAPAFPLEIYTGDSLLLGRRLSDVRGLSVPLDPDAAVRRALATEDAQALTRVLGQTYQVVVGNPPYITPKDAALNRAYRELYGSCHRNYSLVVPLVERFFDLAATRQVEGDSGLPAGYVGMIVGNAFMKREFGKKLIEQYFPRWDATHIIDTSGAYIPGHGTPTVIIIGRHQNPTSPTVRAVLGIRGEPETPADPARGQVWSAIVAQTDCPGSTSDFVSVVDMKRSNFERHPWSLGGAGAAELRVRLETHCTSRLGDLDIEIGRTCVLGEDDVWLLDAATARRMRVRDWSVPIVLGEHVRDWSVVTERLALYPYAFLGGPPLTHLPTNVFRYLWPVRALLSARRMFGQLVTQAGRQWFEYLEHYGERLNSAFSLTFAFVATHNHFALSEGGRLFNRSAPVIKLAAGAGKFDYLQILGLLNSSVACFWMKQVSHNMGSTVDEKGARQRTEPFEDFFQFNGSKLLQTPYPDHRPSRLPELLDGLSNSSERPGLDDDASRAENLERRIAFQEELDWAWYRSFGLLEEQVCCTGFDPPPISLGERAFEIVLARKVESGELTTTWFDRHGSAKTADIPSRWPEAYRQIVKQRIEVIESTSDVALIEQPQYKRRWNVEAESEQERRLLRGSLLEQLEVYLGATDAGRSNCDGGQPQLTSCAMVAHQAKRDLRFVGIAEAYLGHGDVDVPGLVTELLNDEAVPFLPVLRYKESGMRKRQAWDATWALQRRRDLIDARSELPVGHADRLTLDEAWRLTLAEVGEIPVPPKYESKDFRSSTLWRLRGKLDLPKERFISYPHANRETDPSPVISWAGWDHLQQAQAVSAYYLLVKEQDGWSAARLTPLLAGLLELIPWLKQWHNDVDPETGERLGDYFDSFLETQARALGLTRAAIRAWKP